jgi:hypothetical protein
MGKALYVLAGKGWGARTLGLDKAIWFGYSLYFASTVRLTPVP